jgi:hypothetical protein
MSVSGAAEDDTLDGGVVTELLGLAEGVDLAIDVQLADTACDELGVLAAMVEDQDAVAHREGCRTRIRTRTAERKSSPLPGSVAAPPRGYQQHLKKRAPN